MVSEAPMASGAILTSALCKMSNRVVRVLAYALLEWILIVLLLANGVFSYLISRFAAFFGLAPPCALCSRLGVDSLFEPHHQHRGGGTEPLRRVLCDAHAAEVSRLGYCRAHRRLADAGEMCEDCASAAAPGKALLSWMRRSEQGERDLACACCGVPLENGFYSPSFLLPKPAARNLDCGYREEAVASLSGGVVFVSEEGPLIELFDEKPSMEVDDSIGVMAAHCANTVGNVGRLVPLESNGLLAITMAAVSSQSSSEWKEAIYHGIAEPDCVVPENLVNANEEKILVNCDDEKVDETVDRLIDEEIAALAVLPVCVDDKFDNEITTGETAEGLTDEQPLEDDSGLTDKEQETSIGKEISEDQAQQGALKKELFSMPTDPWKHESVACGSWTSNENMEGKKVQEAELDEESDSVCIYPREHADEEFGEDKITHVEFKQELDSAAIDSREQIHSASNENTEGKPVEQAELKRRYTFVEAGVLEHVIDSIDGNIGTDKDAVEVDPTEAALPSPHQISHRSSTNVGNLAPSYNDMEEGGAPDTPIHIEGVSDIQELPNHKAMRCDARSIDSSVATMSTDMESIELVSVDQLKSALAAARKSLNTLYAELDNERSAAAIAADETMAMINRLQEQKAAMQMEAIQYQRLMEEQSEYDQEALQRLNELIVKRDKEKQDLERELELYRHKVHLYETKERRKLSRQKTDDQNGSSSASSSAEGSDDFSHSFYEGDESAHGLNGSNGSTPTDVVLQETARHLITLDAPLGDFEEERLSIMEQLKVLEERLFDLEDEDPDNMKMDKQFSPENHLSGATNGFSDEDSSLKLHEKRKGVSYRGKKLLPLFDDATMENGNDLLPKQDARADDSAEVVLELSKEQDKLAIASEIDQVHERLHALEADREFIKQCVRSLNKGGKGFDLLQEILQHLRDLRRIEQHARKSGDLSPYYMNPYTD